MKIKIAAAVLAVCSLAAAVFAATTKEPVPAQPDVALHVIGKTQDTEVLHFRHEGHDCYVASAHGASGVSLQCPR